MKQRADGRRGVVAAGHEQVAKAAASVLEEGGNAFDAIVAAGFASAAAEPLFTSLGGGGFCLAVTPERETVFDFFCDTPGRGAPEAVPHFEPVTVAFPGATQVFHVGRGAVAVPGILRGFLEVHQQLGRLPLSAVVAPAARLAREGVPLSPLMVSALHLLRPIVTLTEESKAIYAPGGKVPEVGERLAMPELASFLDEVPRGIVDDFYEGELAAQMERDMRAGGGVLGRGDLAAYRVIERAPLVATHGSARVLLNPAPSRGGLAVARLLKLFAAREGPLPPFGSPGHVRLLALCMREGERLLQGGIDDEALASAYAAVRTFSRGTTHVSVADGEGNVATMTTSNGEGAGVLAPGTGIMLNNMLGEDDLHPGGWHQDPPGARICSMMCPTVVVDENGPRLALGSGGSKRIRTALFQVLTHVLDHGLSLGDAVAAPRVHWDGETLQVEAGLSEDALRALAGDVELNVWAVRDLYFGGVHAVEPAGEAAGDPRRSGVGVIVR